MAAEYTYDRFRIGLLTVKVPNVLESLLIFRIIEKNRLDYIVVYFLHLERLKN